MLDLPPPTVRLKRSNSVLDTPEEAVAVKKPKPKAYEFSALQKADQAKVAELHGTDKAFAATVSQLSPMVRVGLGEGGKGTMGVTIDGKGAISEPHDVPAPRSDAAMKQEAFALGTSMRTRFLGMKKEDRVGEIQAMEHLAGKLTSKAFENNIFKSDKEDYSTLMDSFGGKRFTGSQFRNVEPALDEHTQSAMTAAFHGGFRKAGEGEKSSRAVHADQFASALLKAQSAMRLDTAHTVAPVIQRDVTRTGEDESGKATSSTSKELFGHQHVTRHEIREIERGPAVSQLAHRDRAQGWIDALGTASSVTTGVFVPMAASIAAAGAGTMRGMAHPLAGVPGAEEHFGEGFVKEQTSTRDKATKRQTNSAAKAAGLAVDKSTQKFDAPKQASPFPSSPRRE
ncbi:MAG TPA: hypothetical protein VGO76_09015 [Luteibacter sp.]|jgi:hypothetical protein|nr:hypothetical protein [Luteibacter sp.]